MRDIYKVGGPDWARYFDDRDEALKAVRRLNRIPAGQPYAGCYGVQHVTDPRELDFAREFFQRKRRRAP